MNISRTKVLGGLFATIAVLSLIHVRLVFAQDGAPKPVEPVQPAIAMLGKLVGGVWRTEGNFKAEFRYEWRVPGKSIRALGKAAIGTPQEFPMESLYGWDDKVKKVYYMDFHSSDTIYKGYAEMKDGKFVGDFEGFIGDTGSYRFSDELTDNNTLVGNLYGKNKAGDWVLMHTLTFKRTDDKGKN